MTQTIFDFSARTNKGPEQLFSDFRGKTLLIVNTASKCGFTPQYKGLEELNQKYRDRGLVIVGFPCDQFAHQEPGDDAAIAAFCQLNFGVSFPLMAKIEVNGPGEHPLFRFLKTRSSSLFGRKIKWNFTKFLVSPDGTTVRRYAPTTEPVSLSQAIEQALSHGPA